MKKSIEEVSENFICTNCGACKAACPNDSISFVFTNIGRMHARVNHDTCVDCGLCRKVCPSLNFEDLFTRKEDPYYGNVLNAYVVRAKDKIIFSNAQSGGMCTISLKYLFDNNLIDAAIVCKTDASESPIPKAIIVRDPKQLLCTQKSNYTPVEILSVIKELKASERVALVGLPCHIKASILLAERIKKYDVIKYRLGLVCDRTLCNGITDVFGSLSGFRNFKVIWRCKNFDDNGQHYSYKNAPVVVSSDESFSVKKTYSNRYRIALKDMFTAPHCKICYDKVNVFSDIVFGDPWCMDDVDWNNGDSLVITRSEVGDSLMKEIVSAGYVDALRNVDKNKALEGQFVNERKKRFPLYVNAFRKSINSSIVDIIYKTIPFQESDFITQAQIEINQFIENEKLPKELILKKAMKIIKLENRKLLFGRIKSYIKKTIKIISKK